MNDLIKSFHSVSIFICLFIVITFFVNMSSRFVYYSAGGIQAVAHYERTVLSDNDVAVSRAIVAFAATVILFGPLRKKL